MTTLPQSRPARPGDAEAIARLHIASWRQTYRNALSEDYLAEAVVPDRMSLWEKRLTAHDPLQHVLLAEEDGVLLGFACAFIHADPAWGALLDNIHVAQEAQGSGVGSHLLRAIARHCTMRAPHSGLFLWVLQQNVAAQRFYLRHGARNAGADVWDAPGGNRVPRFRLAWPPGTTPNDVSR
ncbi:MAG: hypothetical protein RLZZ618_1959 [Pseudomonadota bacterium]|jgi:ribosomal protein S18 acetylase RimI-like enzyme